MCGKEMTLTASLRRSFESHGKGSVFFLTCFSFSSQAISYWSFSFTVRPFNLFPHLQALWLKWYPLLARRWQKLIYMCDSGIRPLQSTVFLTISCDCYWVTFIALCAPQFPDIPHLIWFSVSLVPNKILSRTQLISSVTLKKITY